MNNSTLQTAAIIFLVIPTVAYGGYFILAIIRRKKMGMPFANHPFAQRMFRAGHAHAGTWLILSLVALLFIDQTHLSAVWQSLLRYSFPFSALFISAGFFAAPFPLKKRPQ